MGTDVLLFLLISCFICFMCRVRSDFELAVEGIKKHLIRHSEPNKLLYIGELLSARTFSPKMVSRRLRITRDTPALMRCEMSVIH